MGARGCDHRISGVTLQVQNRQTSCRRRFRRSESEYQIRKKIECKIDKIGMLQRDEIM